MGTREKHPWKINSFVHKEPSFVGPNKRKDKFNMFIFVGIDRNLSVFGSYSASRCLGQ